MFYPVDFGYVTPTEFYCLEPLLDSFSALPCTLLALSTEHIASQRKAQAAPRSVPLPTTILIASITRSEAGLNMLPVRLASDPVGDVAKQYGVYKAEENLWWVTSPLPSLPSYRAMFLVDPEGRIVAMEKGDFPVGRSMVEQLRVVQAAMAIRAR